MHEVEGTAKTSPAADKTVDWAMVSRIALKALLLFVVLNALFAACRPLDTLGQASLYNTVWPGRERLPYGERPQEDNNLTLNNIPAMMASHGLDQPKASNEFRVLVIGDSGTWGWFLDNEDTLSGQLNARQLVAADGRRVVFYNLGYPVMSLTKDALLLEAAMASDPDLILWPITLQSMAATRQLEHPLLQNNADRVRTLIATHDLSLDPQDERLVDPSWLDETIVGRRRDLADLLRLQILGLPWAATGIDQAIPVEIPQRATDLEADESWLDIPAERPLTDSDLTFDLLEAGKTLAGDTPVLLINEPVFISDGANSDIRYNSFYPRWAYDQYRVLVAERAATEGWTLVDLWDAVPAEEFTDTPVHLSPQGSAIYAELVEAQLLPFLQQR